tara:strand:- start:36393 stop:36974 length:582 start_codon:yes stop_codon:yes gene_type:complete
MKKVILKSLLAMSMFGTLTSYAKETPFTKGNGNVTKVSLYNVKKGQSLFIKNTNGKIIIKDIIKSSGSITKGYDFTTLDNGYYTLEINKDYQIDVKPFTIISGEAIFHAKAEKIIFKPVIRFEENKILISKLDFEETEMVIIIFYENEMIFTDIIKGNLLIEKVYGLQKEIKGNYKIVTKVNDREYIKEIPLI